MYAIRSYYELKALQYQVKARENEIKTEVKSRYVEVVYALRLQQSRKHQLDLAQELYRITSYNVCYTKLLRLAVQPSHFLRACGIIAHIMFDAINHHESVAIAIVTRYAIKV